MNRDRTEDIEPTCSICSGSSQSISFTVLHVITNTLTTFLFMQHVFSDFHTVQQRHHKQTV